MPDSTFGSLTKLADEIIYILDTQKFSIIQKKDYTKYYKPLSEYDTINCKAYTKNITQQKSKSNRPKTANEFALRTFR